MTQACFIGRMNASLEMARKASSASARLIHHDLAGRYSVAAVDCAGAEPRLDAMQIAGGLLSGAHAARTNTR